MRVIVSFPNIEIDIEDEDIEGLSEEDISQYIEDNIWYYFIRSFAHDGVDYTYSIEN